MMFQRARSAGGSGSECSPHPKSLLGHPLAMLARTLKHTAEEKFVEWHEWADQKQICFPEWTVGRRGPDVHP